MAYFLIKRSVPGATQDDIDAASFRAITCAFYFPGLRWLRSFWDRDAGVIHCVYEAKDEAEVYAHAQRARIPCDEVRMVNPFGPDDYTTEGAAGQGRHQTLFT
jgi:hypothetical protein